MTAIDTRALIEAAQAGDRDAFGQLYAITHPKVTRFIQKRVGRGPLAEDLAHDVYVRALTNLGAWSWRGVDPCAWLITIARNLIADHFKKAATRLTEPAGDDLPGCLADPDRRVDPAQVAEVSATNAAVNAAIAELVPAQRRVLAHRFGAERSVEETAQAMGTTTGAVQAAQRRALRRLATSPHLAAIGGGA